MEKVNPVRSMPMTLDRFFVRRFKECISPEGNYGTF